MDTLFLITSKAVWLLIRPETLLLGLFAFSWLLLQRGGVVAARRCLTISLSLALVIALFPVGHLVLNPLERAFPRPSGVEDVQGLIVLGGAEDEAPDHAGNVAQINEAGDRLISAIALSRVYPNAIVLYSGGKVALDPAAPGSFSLGPEILLQLGLAVERLIVEGQSRTTAENAVLSRALIPEQGRGRWLLITSAFHMPRAMATFCAAGWRNLTPYPTDYRGGAFWKEIGWNFAGNLGDLNTGIKEWVGLLAYRITGRAKVLEEGRCDRT